jgi:hypothetical protein
MPSTNAVILIPDISGFTHFMSSMELEHASHVITSFLETIVKATNGRFEVSEIEGDAVLLYKKGGVETKQELLDLCLEIFNAFHYQRKMMQQVVLCHCGACQSIINLSLKFIAHYGVISEIKVDRFVKASGLDMIIAHRLLKNSINSGEYILLTDNLLHQVSDQKNECGLAWKTSAEEFASIGKVNFQYAVIEDLKSTVPDPPKHDVKYIDHDQGFYELDIMAPYKDVYMALMDMVGRVHWMSGLKEVKQESDHPFVGSIHYCSFDEVRAEISPLHVEHRKSGIHYAETMIIKDADIYSVYEYLFRPSGSGCSLAVRILSMEDKDLSEQKHTFLFDALKASCHTFKAFCENGFQPLKK